MPTPRQHAGAFAVDGLLYVVGGDTGCSAYGNLLDVYDPGTDLWSSLPPMPTPRGTFAAAVLNGQIYVVGGVGGAFGDMVDNVEAYDPVTNTWSTAARSGLGCP